MMKVSIHQALKDGKRSLQQAWALKSFLTPRYSLFHNRSIHTKGRQSKSQPDCISHRNTKHLIPQVKRWTPHICCCFAIRTHESSTWTRVPCPFCLAYTVPFRSPCITIVFSLCFIWYPCDTIRSNPHQSYIASDTWSDTWPDLLQSSISQIKVGKPHLKSGRPFSQKTPSSALHLLWRSFPLQ